MCHVDRFRPSTLRDSGSAISIIVRKRAGAPADEGLRCARCAGGARCAGCGKRGGGEGNGGEGSVRPLAHFEGQH